MELIYLYAPSKNDYSEVFSHYQTRELTQEEKTSGIWGKFAITFNSLEELARFQEEVGDIVICNELKHDGSSYKAIIIYDGYLE